MIAIPTRRAVTAGPAVHDDDVDLNGGMSVGRSEVRPGAALPAMHRLDDRVTGAAAVCIARFAELEADVSSADLSGVGRVSSARLPRLGGVLHGRIAPGSRAAKLLEVSAERTVSAGYQAVLATYQITDVPVRFVDADDLWEEFLPTSYRIPGTVATTTWDVCGFDEFWMRVLVELGLPADAHRVAKGQVSPLSRSIRGLSTVGVALALTERGGRSRRLVVGGRESRGPRHEGRSPASAPLRLLGDAETQDSAPPVLVEVATPRRSSPRRVSRRPAR